jgi:quercetin dioxygenase-like cupin family protein
MAGEKKNLDKPDETRTFGKGKVDLVKIGSGVVGRTTFEPGWKWSEHVKPIAGTELCEVEHCGVQISGRMKVVLKGGEEMESGPGDVMFIPAGHDAWVVGNEPVVMVDWAGMANYAKPR